MLNPSVPHCQPEFFSAVPQPASCDPFTNNNYLPGGTFQPEMEPVGLTPRMMQGTCAAPTLSQPTVSPYGGRHAWAPGVTQMQGMIATSPMAANSGGYAQACWPSPVPGMNSFTFTSPTATQGNSVLLPFQPAYSQSQAAPGMGVSWQHAVPKHMPWVQESSFPHPELVNFSGLPGNTPAMPQAVPFHCDNSGRTRPHRRMKRHAEEGALEPPSKLHVSEERMAAELQGLCITEAEAQGARASLPSGDSIALAQRLQQQRQQPPSLADWAGHGQQPMDRDQMWEHFKKVERSLAQNSEEEEEEAEEESGAEQKQKGVLKILCDSINKPLDSPKVFSSSSLPVLDDSSDRAKSMQLVLWKPSPLSGILASGSSSEEEEDEDASKLQTQDASISMINDNDLEATEEMDVDFMEDDDLEL